MSSNLFGNFSSNDEKKAGRSKSITSLKVLKLKQIKPNPNINSIINLSRIYAQDQSAHTKNIVKSFSPSNSIAVDINSAVKLSSTKVSKPNFYISAKTVNTMKNNSSIKKSPTDTSRSKFSMLYGKPTHKDESLKTTKIETNLNSDRVVEPKIKITKIITSNFLRKPKKNISVVSSESLVNSSFRSKVVDLFEKFKNSHYEIIKNLRH